MTRILPLRVAADPAPPVRPPWESDVRAFLDTRREEVA